MSPVLHHSTQIASEIRQWFPFIQRSNKKDVSKWLFGDQCQCFKFPLVLWHCSLGIWSSNTRFSYYQKCSFAGSDPTLSSLTRMRLFPVTFTDPHIPYIIASLRTFLSAYDNKLVKLEVCELSSIRRSLLFVRTPPAGIGKSRGNTERRLVSHQLTIIGQTQKTISPTQPPHRIP